MNNNNPKWEKIEGNWKQFKGSIQERWGKLTDDEIAEIRGKREQLVGKLQEKYGAAREDVNRQVDEWVAEVTPS